LRVLLDETLPHKLAEHLPEHQVETVQGLGWSGTMNGELLRRCRGRFDVFLTMDRNLEHQQGIAELDFGVVLIRAYSNRMVDLLPLMNSSRAAIAASTTGTLSKVG
jgi:hypothetical protein